jgi:hypothetical protein
LLLSASSRSRKKVASIKRLELMSYIPNEHNEVKLLCYANLKYFLQLKYICVEKERKFFLEMEITCPVWDSSLVFFVERVR